MIATSNQDLEQEVAAGRFRADLYYRLNVVGFHLPPLREQRSLVFPLVNKFIGEFAARNRRDIREIAANALQVLQDYGWPGNVRELRNVIERAVALCPGTEIHLSDLSHVVSAAPAVVGGDALYRGTASETAAANVPSSARALTQTKEAAEATRIAVALKRHRNNRLRTAAELGISRMTLYKKLHKYGLFGAT